jgi:hypothetical protein
MKTPQKTRANHFANEKQEIIELDPLPVSRELKKRWSYFIRKVYETNPLTCPKCQGEMRIISFMTNLT